MRQPVSPLEVFGLVPFGPALRQCAAAILGDDYAPPSRFGVSSLKVLEPRIALPLWLGRTRADGRVVVYLLPNRARRDDGGGYSVRVTDCEDFRGRQLSYDGHAGTDFAVPPGTEVVAVAPGTVRIVRNDMQRGGLKVVLDHGGGLITTYNHLSRALVSVGQSLGRGEVLGLSGMSGVDGVLFSPWLAPHLHLNVLLDGWAVDPFPRGDEPALWRSGGSPTPHAEGPGPELEPTEWAPDALERALAACKDPEMRARLASLSDVSELGAALSVERLFNYHRFSEHPRLCAVSHPRRPVLDLPFLASDYQGVVFADELF